MLEFVLANPFNTFFAAIAAMGAIVSVVMIVAKTAIWIAGMNTLKSDFDAFTKQVRRDFREVRQDIKILYSRQAIDLAGHNSPLTLNAKGEKVSGELQFKALAKELAVDLQARAEGKEEYDIQQLSTDFAHDEFQPTGEMEGRMKAAAFKYSVPLYDVEHALGLEIRDELFRLVGLKVPRRRKR